MEVQSLLIFHLNEVVNSEFQTKVIFDGRIDQNYVIKELNLALIDTVD